MLARLNTFEKHFAVCCWAAVIAVAATARANGSEKVLHAFQGGDDGLFPFGQLVTDTAGNLYGTTVRGGGARDCSDSSNGCGTIYRIAPSGAETVVHAFAGGCDGAFPHAGLVTDKVGNMYGTTQTGGICSNDDGFGTVYKLAPDGTETVLYSFQDGTDGAYPSWNLIIDRKGNLYGASEGGGHNQCCGVLFEVPPKGKLKILHAFVGGSDGAGPEGNMVMDKDGNIFGAGGTDGYGGSGCGTVFELAPDGTVTTIYAFQGDPDGWLPENGVVADNAGNLYGTTAAGGTGIAAGTVFKVTPDGTESLLVSFQGGTDGGDPEAGVVLDKAGNLFGTTYYGGTGCGQAGCGIVFELAPDGTETVLNAFDKRHFGRNPSAGVLLGKHGVVYGTTLEGGKGNNGVVFELKK